MTLYNWLCVLGIPTLIGACWTFLGKRLIKTKTDTEALKLGVQALLRSQLIADYNKYIQKGYAPIYVKENFENLYRQYHSLGANGVMDGLHDTFKELPTEDPLSKKPTTQD